jgi:hypothetical protein
MERQLQHPLTAEEAQKAHAAYLAAVPKRLTYEIASGLIEEALAGKSQFDIAEVLGMAINTLNWTYYKRNHFNADHLAVIKSLVKDERWRAFRDRSISSLTDEDMSQVVALFNQFEATLTAASSSRILNLLAPSFFPIMTPTTAGGWKIEILISGEKGPKYWEFMQNCQPRFEQLKEFLPEVKESLLLAILHERNILKFGTPPLKRS